MINIKLVNAGNLCNILQLVSLYQEEPLFEFKKDNVTLQLTSQDQISFMKVVISQTLFMEYPVEKDFECKINVKSLIKAIKGLPQENQVEMVFNDNIDTIGINVYGKVDKNFQLRLQEVPTEDYAKKVPNIKPCAQISCNTAELLDIITSCLDFTKKGGALDIKFQLTEQFLDVMTSDKAYGSSLIKLYKSDKNKIIIQPEEFEEDGKKIKKIRTQTCKYNKKYIETFLASAKFVSKDIIFKFQSNYPCAFEISKPAISLEFYLGPINDID